jgi:hypothetical protein
MRGARWNSSDEPVHVFDVRDEIACRIRDVCESAGHYLYRSLMSMESIHQHRTQGAGTVMVQELQTSTRARKVHGQWFLA